jgi:sarcosine oxidase/L-pipecolate oxidase
VFLPSFDAKHRQCIAMVQLTQEEADIYKNCPVVLDFESGFYIFPVSISFSGTHSMELTQSKPNEQNLVKMAIHAGKLKPTING